uniref:Dual specificity protein phosphatase 22 isoform X3 n=1 Tax=Camelus bactrianus TaxID=9837 RepID=A0A9W3FJ94_CAMBA|nr:dual specificity protein phosphatase 22 isoform X3 [Camelus bactrianus]
MDHFVWNFQTMCHFWLCRKVNLDVKNHICSWTRSLLFDIRVESSLAGSYILYNARDAEQLSRNKVTHILSVHDSARPMLEGVKYLCIPAADSPSQNLVVLALVSRPHPRHPRPVGLGLGEPGGGGEGARRPSEVAAMTSHSPGPEVPRMTWSGTRHFRESIKFIHECRLGGEGCLVHWYVHLWPAAAAEQSRSVCEGLLHLPEPRTHTPRPCWLLAGVSRSVTLVVAYIMTVTDFGWEDALHTVRAGRSCANPNLGFQRQLQEFEKHQVHQFRQWLREEYGENPLRDAEAARSILAVLSPHGEQPHVRPLPLSSCAPPRRLPLAARASLRGLHAPQSWKKERFWAPSRFPLEYAFKSP